MTDLYCPYCGGNLYVHGIHKNSPKVVTTIYSNGNQGSFTTAQPFEYHCRNCDRSLEAIRTEVIEFIQCHYKEK